MSREPRNTHITDEGSLHKYATLIPHTVTRGLKSRGLSVYAKWLYVYIKSRSGESGECFCSTTTIAAEAGMSRGQVSTAKKELVQQGLVAIAKSKNPKRDADHMRIKDIWPLNMQEFSVHNMNTKEDEREQTSQDDRISSVHTMNTETEQSSPHEHQSSPHEHQSSPHELGVHIAAQKKYPLRISQEEGKPPVSIETSPPLTPAGLIDLYNALTPETHPKVEKRTAARIKKASAALRQCPGHPFWETVFDEIGRSDFLRGLKPSPGHENFVASLDWLLSKGKNDQVENYVKVFEGRYREPPRASPILTRAEQRAAAEAQSNRELEDLVYGRNTTPSPWDPPGRHGPQSQQPDPRPGRQGSLLDGRGRSPF